MTPPYHTGTIIQLVEKSKFNGNFNSAVSFNGTDSESYIIDQNQPVMVRTHSVSVKGLKPELCIPFQGWRRKSERDI